MKKFGSYFILFSIFSMVEWPAHALGADSVSFSPESKIFATLKINKQDVSVILTKGDLVTTETIHVDTEKTLSLEVKDYNFDGRNDFSISHIDDGMGTYRIYQIYVFSPQQKKFIPLQPKCGDEFINAVISDKKHTLTNSFFSDNQIKTCTMKF